VRPDCQICALYKEPNNKTQLGFQQKLIQTSTYHFAKQELHQS